MAEGRFGVEWRAMPYKLTLLFSFRVYRTLGFARRRVSLARGLELCRLPPVYGGAGRVGRLALGLGSGTLRLCTVQESGPPAHTRSFFHRSSQGSRFLCICLALQFADPRAPPPAQAAAPGRHCATPHTVRRASCRLTRFTRRTTRHRCSGSGSRPAPRAARLAAARSRR